MAFITHYFAKNKPAALTAWLILALLPLQTAHAAEHITVVRAQGMLTESGQMDISCRFKTTLPDNLTTALRQGLPLHFTLDYRLSAPTFAAYRFRLMQFIRKNDKVSYRLNYHPLTNRYRVSIGTFSSDYHTLDNALRGIGAIVNWRIFAHGSLSEYTPQQIKAEIRLSLSTDQLPKPFQINSISAQNWSLDSGWQPVTVEGN